MFLQTPAVRERKRSVVAEQPDPGYVKPRGLGHEGLPRFGRIADALFDPAGEGLLGYARRMLVLNDGVLQLLDGADVFSRQPTGEHEFVVIVRAHEQRLALSVDDLIGQRELVTRPLPPEVSEGAALSGAAC